MKKLLGTVLTVLLAVALSTVAFATEPPYATWAAAADAAVENTDYTVSGDTYTIKTALGLAWVADQVNNQSNYFSGQTVKLDCNIDLTTAGVTGYGADTVTATNSWTAIGTTSSKYFQGTFDGNNCTVSGVYINNDQEYVGLFGYVRQDSGTPSVQDVGIVNSSITTTGGYAGGLVGYLRGYTVENCYSTATVSAVRAGSLAGYSTNSSTITNCYATGDVTGSFQAGGLVGSVYDSSKLEKCYATGTVRSNSDGSVGGLVGYVSGSALTNCYATGNASYETEGGAAGGLVGQTSSSSSTTNCYAIGEASCDDDKGATGELIGTPTGNTSSYCYVNSDITDASTSTNKLTTEEMTGLGAATNMFLDDSAWTFTAYTLNEDGSVTAPYPILTSNPQDPAPTATFGSVLSWGMAAKCANENTDYTVSGDTYTIFTALGLAWVADQVNGGNSFSGKTVELDADIDLLDAKVDGYNEATIMAGDYSGGKSWPAIGYSASVNFQGNFDGNGHTVSHVYINCDQTYLGLFGYVLGDTTQSIKNVGVIDSSITNGLSSGDTGSLVGYLEGYTVENCYSTATVSGGVAGGLVGYSTNSSTITNCYAIGAVNGTTVSGGLVGYISENVTITNCYYNSETSNCTIGAGGYGTDGITPLTTEEMTGLGAATAMSLDDSTWTFTAYTLNGDGTVTAPYPTLTQSPAPTATFDSLQSWAMAAECAVSGTDYTQDRDGNYTISTALGLAWLADQVNGDNTFYDNTITLANDINLADTGITDNWTPIGTSGKPFKGTFDGATYEISGLYINSDGNDNQGLFGYTDSGTIKNLTLSGSVTSTGSGYVGGIVGLANAATITNCINNATVTGVASSGGIVGYYSAEEGVDAVTDCANSGTISVSDASGKTGEIYGDRAYAFANSYTVTFDADGGTVTGWSGIQTNTSGAIHADYELPTASRSGYTFKGWYDEDGVEVTAETTFTADTVVTASFSKNSSGSTTTTTTTTTTTDTTTNDDGSVTATASTSTSTSGSTVTATVSDSNMDTAIENAVDADEGDGVYVEIPVTTKSSTDTVTATMSTDAVEALVDADVDALVVSSDLGTLEIPTEALEEILDQASGSDLTITVSYVDPSDLTDAQANIIGDGVVVDLAVTSGDDVISSFGGHEITVTLPYTLGEDEDAENIVVWYIADDGTITVLATAYDEETGTVTFVTTHFSVYAIIHDTNTFTDVDVNAYYYDAVQWAVDNGITSGYSDTIFGPSNACTRAQAVTFLWRAASSPAATADTATLAFTDLDTDAYYYDAVVWAVENGITAGYEDGTFGPDITCNRGAIVTFLYRLAGEPEVSGEALSDVIEGAYYYDAVLWAIENGITTGYTDGTFGPATTCNRGAIVTFLYRYLG